MLGGAAIFFLRGGDRCRSGSINGALPTWVDFRKSVEERRLKGDNEQTIESTDDSFETVGEILAVEHNNNEEWSRAKNNELNSWKENLVYTEVPDFGQDRIQSRWICTTKDAPHGKVAKARLVAMGFFKMLMLRPQEVTPPPVQKRVRGEF